VTHQPTGSERVLEFLRDRRFHTLAEIELECRVEGRSRLSDLRRLGHVLERRRNPGGLGKAKYSHRLAQTAFERSVQDEEIAALEEPEAGMPASVPGSSSGCGLPDGGKVEVRDASDAGDGSGTVGAGPDPAVDLEDAGWRELFPAESGEALPPPSNEPVQLPLLEEAV
jgi:hypothetical protein